MPAITYSAYLAWANDHRGLLLHVSTRVAMLESADQLLSRWRQVRDLGDALASHLEEMIKLSMQSIAIDEALMEEQILKELNAPIQTAAKVERETRDVAWLHKQHGAVSWLLTMLDEALVSPPLDDEWAAPQPPAPETEPEVEAAEPIASDGTLSQGTLSQGDPDYSREL